MAGLDIAGRAKGITSLGLELAGNAKTKATLHLGKVQAGDFNWDTGKTDVDTVAGGRDVEIEGFKYRSKEQQAEAVVGNDAVFLVDGKDVPEGIKEDDTLTIDGVTWNITGIEPVPTEALYKIYIRR